jgi:hypothetical protein
MAAGNSFHRGHGRLVLFAGALRLAAWLTLLAALALLAAVLTLQLLP